MDLKRDLKGRPRSNCILINLQNRAEYIQVQKNIDNLRHFYFLQDHTTTDQKMGKDKHKDGVTAASSKTNRDHSQDQEARDTTLAQTITEAVAREVAKAHAH